ncbi:hypothetical protein [Companilactobacillus nuruki]|uniref:Uncharacterized protein n=1 Tax=Companilactobacillus nuruki TaxID=1993540 RepID=A0A2N7AUJ4_9LACO|nr:hypothetical protein [Companilactobacillus nuruki]PMD70775.1 hypothetical protein CBP76_06185 [Companilactobacillus nuruki]
MIKNLPTRFFIVFLCTLIVPIIYILSPRDISSIFETKIIWIDKSKQRSIDEFNSTERKHYSYVSFDNLYDNTGLYYGSRIFQIGHIQNVDLSEKYLLVALDDNDESRTIKLKYNLSNFARGGVKLQENEPIKFYGRVLTTDSYVNERGRNIDRPVISADFIQTKLDKRGNNYGTI